MNHAFYPATGENGPAPGPGPNAGARTAFVTGGTGFLGGHLAAHLTAAGWRVTALHRPGADLSRLRTLPVTLVAGSLDDPAALAAAVPAAVDAVFHVAADTSFWSRHRARQTRTNVDGTRHLVAAALRRGARRLVHTSSVAVYGFPAGEIIDERLPHRGAGSWVNYNRTKAAAEVEVRRGIDRGLDATILNPAHVIGSHDRHGWSYAFRLVQGGRLPALPPGRGSFCPVGEVAAAHLAAVDRGRTGENYLLGGTDASYADMLRIIGGLLGRPVPSRQLPGPVVRAAARLSTWAALFTGRAPALTPEMAAYLSRDLVCRSDKAVRELGYGTGTPLRAMLADCHRWLVGEGGGLPAGPARR